MALGTPIAANNERGLNTSDVVISSFSTVADELLILSVTISGTGSQIPDSITGHDGSSPWVQIGSTEQASVRHSQSLWACHSSGSTDTLTISYSTSSVMACDLARITGADVSGTVANSFHDFESNNGYGTSCSAAALTGSDTSLGFYSVFGNRTLIPENTELLNYKYSYNQRSHAVDYGNTAAFNCGSNATTTSVGGGCVAIELLEASAGGGIAYLSGSFDSNSSVDSSTTSWAYDSGATGSDRVLVVFPVYENNTSADVTAVTYNGVPMTFQEVYVDDGGGFAETIEAWTLVNPAAGSNTLSFTLSETGRDFGYSAAVYTGVDQTTPVGNTAISGQYIDENNIDADLLFAANSMGVYCSQQNRAGSGPFTAKTGNTQRGEYAVATGNSGFTACLGDRGPEANVSDLTPTCSLDDNSTWSCQTCGIKEASAGGISAPVGLATETDTAQSVTPQTPLTVTIGLASETDSALSVSPVSALTVNIDQALETDTAHSITPSLATVLNIGLAIEVDTALSVTPEVDLSVSLGIASETDTALSVTASAGTAVSVGLAAEVDSALTVTPVTNVSALIGLATETDSAQSVTPVSAISVNLGQASEADSALSISPISGLTVDLGIASELDQALSVAVGLDLFVNLGQASELDEALLITPTVVQDYVTPRHNMTLTIENRIMTLTIENRIMGVK